MKDRDEVVFDGHLYRTNGLDVYRRVQRGERAFWMKIDNTGPCALAVVKLWRKSNEPLRIHNHGPARG